MATIKKIEFINNPNIANYTTFKCVNDSTEIEQYGDVFIEELNGNKVKTNFLSTEEDQRQFLNQSLEHIKNAEVICRKTQTILRSLNIDNIGNESYDEQEVIKIIDENLIDVCSLGARNDNLIEDWNDFLQNSCYLNEFIRDQYFRSINKLLLNFAKITENVKKLINSLGVSQKHLGQATYRSLLNGTKGKQKGTLSEIINVEEEEKRKNLTLIANLVNQDETLSQDEKMKIFTDINKSQGEKKVIYEINQWLGQKLGKRERRLIRVIRRVAYKQIKEDYGENTKGAFLYQLDISMSEIYKEWGCKARSQEQGGGYHEKQTKIIKELLFGEAGKSLYKDMLFKHKKVIRTRYILQIEEIKKENQLVGVRIALPAFLFVFDEDIKEEKDKQSFIYQDVDGFRRFMQPKGMEQNEAAFELAEYLEEILSCKLEKRLLDLSTMVREAGLEEVYKTRQSRAIERINKILDKMKEARFLISDWQFSEKGGKYGQGQYELHNIRSKLFSLPLKPQKSYKKNVKKNKEIKKHT